VAVWAVAVVLLALFSLPQFFVGREVRTTDTTQGEANDQRS
jgi:hypothetical protein